MPSPIQSVRSLTLGRALAWLIVLGALLANSALDVWLHAHHGWGSVLVPFALVYGLAVVESRRWARRERERLVAEAYNAQTAA